MTQAIKSEYKQTEVGVIPEDWEVKTLKAITTDMLQGVNTAIDIPEYVESGIPMLKANDIIDGNINFDNVDHISLDTFKRYNPRFKPKKYDFLFSNIGARLGTGSLLTLNLKCSFAWNVMRIIPDLGIVNPFFLSYSINSPAFYLQIKLNESGSGMGFVSKNILKNLEIPLPKSLKEQSAIAQALSDTDNLIESLNKLISKKKNVKQGTMQLLLTGKKRLPGFSGEWEEKKLGDYAEMFSGGTPSSKVLDYYGGDIPWISIADMTLSGKFISKTEKTITENGLQNSSARMFSKNTLFLAMYASIGKCCISTVDASTSQAILGIKTNDSLDMEFLYYYFIYSKESISSQGQQGTQSNLNKGMVQDLIIKFPKSKKEQTAIANILSSMDEEIELLEKERDKFKTIKTGMMQQLLTGKIRLKY